MKVRNMLGEIDGEDDDDDLRNKFCFRHFEMEMFVSRSGGEENSFFKARNPSVHVSYMFISMNLKPEWKVQPIVSSLDLISVKVLKAMEENIVKKKVPAKP